MEIHTDDQRRTFYRLSATDVWTQVTVELARQASVGDATVTATGWVADSAAGNGKRDEIMLATERDGSRTLYWRPPYGGGGWLLRPGEWTPEQLAAMLPVEAVPAPYLLLVDADGWAGLYGPDEANKAAGHMQHAELAGDTPFVQAFLVLSSGAVVLARVEGSRTPFDEEDRATASAVFRPFGAQGPLLAGINEEYRVSWGLDGRA